MLVTNEILTQAVGCVNWPDKYPDRPEVDFGIRCTGAELLLRFRVREAVTRAVCTADRQNVWEDSCVEFFFAPLPDGLYYNFECSCTGRLYMACGRGRENRVFLPDEAYSAVRRRPSLGTEAFGLREAVPEWSLELEIPARALAFHELESFSGLHARGNFYKCGNMLPQRHYLSWAPVDTPAPDFHRPEFFEPIDFE